MTYNVHPIFVHFPIALLFVYSVIKIIPLRKFLPTIAWRDIERLLLLSGVLGAFVALQTGEIAEHLVKPLHQLVEMHSLFADIATWLYGALLAGEVAAITREKVPLQKMPSFIAKSIVFLDDILTNAYLAIPLALIALGTLTVTGLLGGVMVYGTSADPLAKIVLSLLGITF